MPLLLSGVEVVEIQMGADAVTVERPGRDGGRGWGPPFRRGTGPVMGLPISFVGVRPSICRRPPGLGEHDDEVVGPRAGGAGA